MKTLYLIRGLPGSGKSTLAKQLSPVVFEADQFFEDDVTGRYVYDREQIGAAHAQCQARVASAMRGGVTPIAVSNTFTQRWELQPYLTLARQYGYTVQEITLTGPLWPNVHGVPAEKIALMRDRWER